MKTTLFLLAESHFENNLIFLRTKRFECELALPVHALASCPASAAGGQAW